MMTIDSNGMCSHLQRKLFNKDGEYHRLWLAIQDDPELTAVVRSRQLHVYRGGKKIMVLAGKAAPKIIREDRICGMLASSACTVSLEPLLSEDREQFILDNQWAFRYGAQIEFGFLDKRTTEGDEVISRHTIEKSIDDENAETYRIVQDGNYVGGVVFKIDKETAKGELELLFVSPEVHGRGIGQMAWREVERMHPEIRVWECITPYFEKRNIHFYVNRCGFHIVEFWNKHHVAPRCQRKRRTIGVQTTKCLFSRK